MKATIFCDDIPVMDWDSFEVFDVGQSWMVAIRLTDNTLHDIATCETRKDAESLVKFLTALINTSEQPPAHT